MKDDSELRGFLKELVEFISLIRASEKERYDVQKNFMDDTIKAMKDISESIKATGEYMRTSIEKMKEILTTGINTIRKEMNIDSVIEAKNVLSEAIDILQRESQLHEFRQTIHSIRTSLENLNQQKLQQASNLQPAPTNNIASYPEETNATPNSLEKSKTTTKSELNSIKISKKQADKEEKKKKIKSEDEKYHIEF